MVTPFSSAILRTSSAATLPRLRPQPQPRLRTVLCKTANDFEAMESVDRLSAACGNGCSHAIVRYVPKAKERSAAMSFLPQLKEGCQGRADQVADERGQQLLADLVELNKELLAELDERRKKLLAEQQDQQLLAELGGPHKELLAELDKLNKELLADLKQAADEQRKELRAVLDEQRKELLADLKEGLARAEQAADKRHMERRADIKRLQNSLNLVIVLLVVLLLAPDIVHQAVMGVLTAGLRLLSHA